MAEGYPLEIFAGDQVNSKYVCCICHLVLRNPVQRYCGHRYCKICVDKVKLPSTNDIECQSCINGSLESEDEDELHEKETGLIYPDNAVRREMLKLQVSCTLCRWNGVFKDFEEHYKGHESAANKCPYGCELQLEPNDDVNQHLKSHFALHLEAILARLDAVLRSINDDVSSNSSHYSHLEERIETLRQQFNSFTVGNVSEMLSQLSTSETSAIGGGSKTTVLKTAKGDTQSAESIEQKMSMVEKCIVLINNEVDKLTGSVQNVEVNHRRLRDLTETVDRHVRTVERMADVKEAVLTDMKMKLSAIELTSYDGSMVWPVPEVKKKRHEAVNGQTPSIYSSPFYTSRTGYKMCLRAYFNGDGMGKNTHLSLFFVVMRGQYDALLRWPFRQKVSMILLSQTGGSNIQDAFRADPNSSSFKRPTSDMNIASGCPTFAPVKVLDDESEGYVKDDRLYIKVIVDVSDL